MSIDQMMEFNYKSELTGSTERLTVWESNNHYIITVWHGDDHYAEYSLTKDQAAALGLFLIGETE